MEADPGYCAALSSLAHSRRLTEADHPVVARLQATLDAAPADHEGRALLHFALGKAFDDLKDYGEAMRHFDAGNALRRRFAPFDPDNFRKRIDRTIAVSTPEFFARHAKLATADATPLLIVGLPRSGTSLVEQILSAHPQVAGAGELSYWAREGASVEARLAEGIPPERARAMIDGYLRYCAASRPGHCG